MMPATINDVIYSTYEEFLETTRVEAYKEIEEEEWEPTALHAQWVIDECVGVVASYEECQTWKFPIYSCCEDGPVIPHDIKKAHIELTTFYLQRGEPKPSDARPRVSESWSSSGYNYNTGGANQMPMELINTLPDLVRNILRKYRTRSTRLTY